MKNQAFNTTRSSIQDKVSSFQPKAMTSQASAFRSIESFKTACILMPHHCSRLAALVWLQSFAPNFYFGAIFAPNHWTVLVQCVHENNCCRRFSRLARICDCVCGFLRVLRNCVVVVLLGTLATADSFFVSSSTNGFSTTTNRTILLSFGDIGAVICSVRLPANNMSCFNTKACVNDLRVSSCSARLTSSESS